MKGKLWEDTSIVVSMGRNGQGRVGGLRIGYFERLQQVLGIRVAPGCLGLSLGEIMAGLP